jgi:hypothetical protein
MKPKETEDSIQNYGFPPVGRCIYCGETQGEMTKEHIIPRAIGGNITLHKASCHKCAKVTSDIERFVCRDMLGAFRVRSGYPTKRGRKRQVEWPLAIKSSDGKVEIKSVPLSSHPVFLLLPLFPPPSILLGLPPNPSQECGIWSRIFHPEVVKSHPEGTSVGGVPYCAETFARMLAKIAHAAAIAMYDPGTFKPFLPQMILGNYRTPLHLVGSIEKEPPPPEDGSHYLYFEEGTIFGRRYLVACIRLFANCGSPIYRVVVGGLLQKIPIIGMRHEQNFFDEL